MKPLLYALVLMSVSSVLPAQQISSVPFRFVNSAYAEQAPVISPDGKVLFFTVANHPQNSGGKKDPGDIWISLWRNGAWSEPVHGDAQLNNESYNAVIGFSRDGNKIYLSGHYSKSGLPKSQGISLSTKTEFGWTFPENISIPYFLNRAKELNGSINLDENIFIFSAESYGTKGVEDIYVSLKTEGKWSEPINLGATINSQLQEWTPSIDEDGKTIFFSSNGRKGLGGFDIYTSSRLDDSWTSWSEPKNIGQAINSDGRDIFFRPFPKWQTSLFTSARNSDAYGNIYAWGDSLKIPERVDTVKSVVVQSEFPAKDKMVLVGGHITNVKTGAGIAAIIEFKSDSSSSVASSPDGAFKIYIRSGKIHNIDAKAKGFVNLSERLDFRSLDLKTMELNLKLQPIEVGVVVNLKSVLFYMGTTALLEESYPELDMVVEFLKGNPKVEIQLDGHTDNRGDAKKNLLLSQQRVEKIKAYLVSKGVQAKRIKGRGFGGSKPIATSDTEESRKLNRRVEFIILKD